jgi:hypothetical protein
MSNPEDEKMIGWLEEQGAIVWDGVADNGEAVFRFDLDKLKEVLPALYEEIMSDIDNDLIQLYQEGFVEIEYDENLNALFRATDKGKKMMQGEFEGE